MENKETINKTHLQLLMSGLKDVKDKETNISCLSYLQALLKRKQTLLKGLENLAANVTSPSWKRDKAEITKLILARLMLLEKYYVVIAAADLDLAISNNWHCESLLHAIQIDLGKSVETWDAYVKLGRLIDGLKMLEEGLVNPKE